MPELPEVETTRRGLAPHLIGERVTGVDIRQQQLRWPVPAELASKIEGQQLLDIERRAKYLLFRFETGTMLVHLGMSGSLRIVSATEPLLKHEHIDIRFGSGKTAQLMRYCDPRRFGAFLWHEGDLFEHKLLNHLGPEPLSEQFDVDYLYQRSRGRSKAIKLLIMEQRMVVGVGNIYANEALFMAGIDPRRDAGRISRKRLVRLVDAIKKVLESAIKAGGTTLKDFIGGDGKPGYFSQELQVYGRADEPCVTCSKPLTKIVQGQRATFFCTRCQR